jgi:hypothetical protein
MKKTDFENLKYCYNFHFLYFSVGRMRFGDMKPFKKKKSITYMRSNVRRFDGAVPLDHLLLDRSPKKLDNSYLVGNLTNSKIDETKALKPLNS